jgi:outer membrane protein OmpA-like peptidoglycan-associated protein
VPADRRRILRAVLSILLLVIGALLAVSIDRGSSPHPEPPRSASVFDEPRFTIRLGRKQLRLAGVTVSTEHEAALMQLVNDQLAGVSAESSFSSAVNLADNWEIITSRLLYLVAVTESAQASIDSGGIAIRGTTQDLVAYDNRLAFLQNALGNNAVVDSDVYVIGNASLDALCQRAFNSINSAAIRFRQSSTTIRLASYPFLDRLAEFAYECDAHDIVVSGHSDSTGAEAWNKHVSHARAQAVADHLIRNGVPANRLVINGFGSSLPIGDNDTVQGRERNRRIEIELRQPH